MQGITFKSLDDSKSYHSYNDFGLILKPRTLQVASPKIETVEIPGADGNLDLTDWFGEVYYKNVNSEYKFSYVGAVSNWDNQYATICSALNGQKMKIIDDRTPDLYRIGRIQISEWKQNKSVGEITIGADCEPYQYKLNKTTMSIPQGQELPCNNARMSTVPTLKGSLVNTTFIFEGNTYTVGTTETVIPSIVLKEGANLIRVTSGVLFITYQEGVL